MPKTCPFKSTAVQRQIEYKCRAASRLPEGNDGQDFEEFLAAAREEVGQCEEEGCQRWLTWGLNGCALAKQQRPSLADNE